MTILGLMGYLYLRHVWHMHGTCTYVQNRGPPAPIRPGAMAAVN